MRDFHVLPGLPWRDGLPDRRVAQPNPILSDDPLEAARQIVRDRDKFRDRGILADYDPDQWCELEIRERRGLGRGKCQVACRNSPARSSRSPTC